MSSNLYPDYRLTPPITRGGFRGRKINNTNQVKVFPKRKPIIGLGYQGQNPIALSVDNELDYDLEHVDNYLDSINEDGYKEPALLPQYGYATGKEKINNNYQNQLRQAKRDSLLYHITGNKDGILKDGFNFDAKKGGATAGKIAGDEEDNNVSSVEKGKEELEKAKKYHYLMSARVNQGNIREIEKESLSDIRKTQKHLEDLSHFFINEEDLQSKYDNMKPNRFRNKPESLDAYRNQLGEDNNSQINAVKSKISELEKNKPKDQNEYGQNNIAKEYVSGYAPYIKKGGSEKPEIVRAYLPKQSFYQNFEVDPEDPRAVRTPVNIPRTSILPRKPDLNNFRQDASNGRYDNILKSLKSSDSYPKQAPSYRNLYKLLYDSDSEDEDMINNPIKNLSLSPEKVHPERFTYPKFFPWPEENQKTGTHF